MPVACDLYLPEDWAHDRKRRLHAGVPSHLTFRTKIEMAIDQIRHAVAAGLPRGIVLADAAYGGARSFRDALRELALSYASGSRATPRSCRPPQRIPPPGAPGPSRSRRARSGSMSWSARGSRTTGAPSRGAKDRPDS